MTFFFSYVADVTVQKIRHLPICVRHVTNHLKSILIMKMKQYIARFVGKNKFTRCETTIECDGINDTHANARAHTPRRVTCLGRVAARRDDRDAVARRLRRVSDARAARVVAPAAVERLHGRPRRGGARAARPHGVLPVAAPLLRAVAVAQLQAQLVAQRRLSGGLVGRR